MNVRAGAVCEPLPRRWSPVCMHRENSRYSFWISCATDRRSAASLGEYCPTEPSCVSECSCSFCWGSSPSWAATPPWAGPLDAELTRRAADGSFSGAVSISETGEARYSAARGDARTGQSPNTVDTKFRFGSMGKMFTAVAIAQLAQAGKLSFGDPLGKYCGTIRTPRWRRSVPWATCRNSPAPCWRIGCWMKNTPRWCSAARWIRRAVACARRMDSRTPSCRTACTASVTAVARPA